MGLDVVSGGEIGIARSVGFPMDRVDFPGNNKSAEELVLALESGLGHIVVDNLHELKMLGEITRERGRLAHVLLRITPGVDPHTHHHIITGNVDSKFGIPLVLGEEAVTTAMAMPTAVSIFFDTPRKGQFPRYCIRRILLTKMQLTASKM